MQSIHSVVTESVKPKFFRPPILVRNRTLILGHLQRYHNLMPDYLRKDLDTLLETSKVITKSMISMAIGRAMNPHGNPASCAEWLVTAQCCIEFRRCLIQALDVTPGLELLQIPHFNHTSLREVTRGKKRALGLVDWLDQPASERKGLVGMTPAQLHDIQLFRAHVPRVQLSHTICVEDEPEIQSGDVITLVFTLTRLHLEEGHATGPVHAPFFPEVEEEWYFFLTFTPPGKDPLPKIICTDRVKSAGRVSTGKMHFHAPRPGTYTFKVEAMCDAYVGLDQTEEVKFTVLEPTAPAIFLHPDDKNLDAIPSLFQLVGDTAAESGSDDEDDEPDAAVKKKAESSSSDDSSDSGDE